MTRQGFTLVEVLVVVLIVGILTAIAYPAFNWVLADAKTRKKDAALHRVLEAKTRYFLDHRSATNVTPSDLVPYLNIPASVGTNAFRNGPGSLFERCFPASSEVTLNPNPKGIAPSYSENP